MRFKQNHPKLKMASVAVVVSFLFLVDTTLEAKTITASTQVLTCAGLMGRTNQSPEIRPLEYLPSWIVDDASKQPQIESAFKRLLQAEHANAGSRSVAADFLSPSAAQVYRTHGTTAFLKFLTTRGPNRDAYVRTLSRSFLGPIDGKQEREIIDVIRSTKDRVFLSNSAFPTLKDENEKIATAIKKLREGRQPITDEDLAALQLLRDRVKSYRDTASDLQTKGDLEGRLDVVVAEYIDNVSNNQFFRDKLTHLNGKTLFINFPKLEKDAGGEYTLTSETKGFTDLKSFDNWVEQRTKILRQISGIKRDRKIYLESYLASRSFARWLEANEPQGIKISHDPTISPEETARRNQYGTLRTQILGYLNSDEPIHPNASLLEGRNRWSGALKGFQNHWLLAASGAVIALAATAINYIELVEKTVARKEQAEAIAEELKETDETLFDHKYWIEKCSSKSSMPEIEECINKYYAKLIAFLRKQVNQKLAKNPDYEDTAEKQIFDKNFFVVQNSIYTKLPLELYAEVGKAQNYEYIHQAVFQAATKKQIAEDAKAANSKATPTTSVLANDPQLAGATLKEKFKSAQKALSDRASKHSLITRGLSDDPTLAAKQDVTYIVFLSKMATNLQTLLDAPPSSPAASTEEEIKIKALIAAELEDITTKADSAAAAIFSKIPQANHNLPEGLANDTSRK